MSAPPPKKKQLKAARGKEPGLREFSIAPHSPVYLRVSIHICRKNKWTLQLIAHNSDSYKTFFMNLGLKYTTIPNITLE